MSNHTPTKPDGTLTKQTLASFFSVQINKDGTVSGKGLGHEQIPANWSVPFCHLALKSPVVISLSGTGGPHPTHLHISWQWTIHRSLPLSPVHSISVATLQESIHLLVLTLAILPVGCTIRRTYSMGTFSPASVSIPGVRFYLMPRRAETHHRLPSPSAVGQLGTE